MLKFGVSLAAVIVFFGGLMELRHPWMPPADYSHFHESGQELRTLAGIFRGALRLHPLSVIQCGLVVLIATPVARVLLCVVGFARQKDMLYLGISLVVLIVLLYSFALAFR